MGEEMYIEEGMGGEKRGDERCVEKGSLKRELGRRGGEE